MKPGDLYLAEVEYEDDGGKTAGGPGKKVRPVVVLKVTDVGMYVVVHSRSKFKNPRKYRLLLEIEFGPTNYHTVWKAGLRDTSYFYDCNVSLLSKDKFKEFLGVLKNSDFQEIKNGLKELFD